MNTTDNRRAYLGARRKVEKTAREFGAWLVPSRYGTTKDKRTTMCIVAVKFPGVLPDPAEIPEPMIDCLGERLADDGVAYRKIAALDFIPPSLRAAEDGLWRALVIALNAPLHKSKILGARTVGMRTYIRDLYHYADHLRHYGEDYQAASRRVLNLSWVWGVRVTLPLHLSSRRAT